ncbi:Hypothetical predicted protein [Olea europaea subsp. europaea]|uniref:Uncharacterized protein n=1 Tax=Olea europaea subsp. europaea TaxID=158383 RepID=A0A8S0RSV5_OLEEU|nr:Hypothetical predicted protein [Olea europaea subsp. europaea]
MYKSRTHLRLLKEWQPVDAVIQRLEGTGFDLVHRINMDYRTTVDFLLALIDHYSVDLSCFIIGDQRITPTLDDVARITGFPIDVLPVLGRDYKANECPDICNELLLSPELLHPKNRYDENQMPSMPGGVESDLGDDFHVGANIFDEGPSQGTEVRESHTEYQTPIGEWQTPIGDFHSPSLGTSGGASPIDESHNEETPTEQHEATPNFAVAEDGMRRGKRVKITPSLLGSFEVDSAIRQIHRRNN